MHHIEILYGTPYEMFLDGKEIDLKHYTVRVSCKSEDVENPPLGYTKHRVQVGDSVYYPCRVTIRQKNY